MSLLVYVTHQGKTLPVEVPSMATVGDLAEEVGRVFELSRPLLLFGGEKLEQQDAALADIGVCPQSALEVAWSQTTFDKEQYHHDVQFDDDKKVTLTGTKSFCFGTETNRVVFKQAGTLNIWVGFLSKGTNFAVSGFSVGEAKLPEGGWGFMYNTCGVVSLPKEQGSSASKLGSGFKEGQLIGFERVSNNLLRVTVDGAVRVEYAPADIGIEDGQGFTPVVPAVLGINASGTEVFIDPEA
eukprot:Hpha_TRINITY_DN19447_c0_g1::TRINITY_DN19447_c0_g1_i1::g.45850::m.45850